MLKNKISAAEFKALQLKGGKKGKPAHRESNIQQACVEWFDLQYPQYSALLFAIPNGGKRGGGKMVKGKGGKDIPLEAAIMKREGVRRGVADMMLAMTKIETITTREIYKMVKGEGSKVLSSVQEKRTVNGLFIETKTPEGKQSKEQKQFEKAVTEQGYQYSICRSTDDFMNVINQYLKK